MPEELRGTVFETVRYCECIKKWIVTFKKVES